MRENNLTTEELKTIDYYNKHANEWRKRHSGGTMFEPEMQFLFKLLPVAKILEVGTGAGEDASKLISHYGLNNYYGIDISNGLIKIAKENNPGANFHKLSVYELGDIGKKFDGFWISAMLIHVPKSKLLLALKNIFNVVRRGGIGFISIMEGSADMEESRPGRHYSLWARNEFEEELKKAKFEIIKTRRIETNASPWLTFLVKRI